MEVSRVKYLVEALITSKLSRSELDDFLSGLEDEDTKKAYSDVFEAYFQNLLERRNGKED